MHYNHLRAYLALMNLPDVSPQSKWPWAMRHNHCFSEEGRKKMEEEDREVEKGGKKRKRDGGGGKMAEKRRDGEKG